ncbi:uncharacterized protein E0L32_007367 [Thyridium curvatum]|uniref:NAD(P)-binding domain-containing protein n=1 Tax=Thyridium curvatum TaxID=1093900 RepID=A0A507B3I0_9PEZI|nr:uncharacterized protein E0L32_007367 [Thyridium curvatum]TPX11869.1 hypothetical protein E0L32_007367 [Thyridium curvatum]
MHFLIIGGTGRTGALIVDEALRQGHSVTALVRPSSSAVAENEKNPRKGLTFHQGSPLKQADVEAALAAAPDSTRPVGAVIVALNPRRASDSPFAAMLPDTPDAPWKLVSGAARAVLPAMRAKGVRRLVLMSMQGAGSSWGSLNVLFRPLFMVTNMRHQIADHNEADALVKEAAGRGEIDYVLVRPVMLAEGEAGEVRVHGDDGRGAGFMPKITRRSVARFIVDAAVRDEYVGRTPVITN